MKKPVALAATAVLVLITVIFGYRSYRADSERAMTAQRLADEQASATQRQAEMDRRAAAEVEAQRLVQMKTQQDAEESAKELAALRAAESSAEAARKTAEDEAVRYAAETERLRREKLAAEGEAKRIAEGRERDAVAAEKARRNALAKLEQVETEKRELTDREAARLAALKRQEELEAAATQNRDLLDRSIYPSDYKRREHYYQEVEMYNGGAANPSTAGTPATPPVTNTSAPISTNGKSEP